MDELESQLQALARQAQSCSPGSVKRQIALTCLTNKLIQSKQLRCKNLYQLPLNAYEDLLQEAIQQTLLEIFSKIEQYDSNKSLLRWVRFLLTRRFKDLCKNYLGLRRVQNNNQQQWICTESLDNLIINSQFDETNLTLQDILANSEDAYPEWEQIRKFVEEDPTGQFRHIYLKNHLAATFQNLLLRRLNGETWKQISQDWQIPISTLEGFYKRYLYQFSTLFIEILQQ